MERDKAEDEEIDTWLNLEHEVELHSSKLSNTSDNPSTIRPTPKKKQIQILIVLRSTPMNTCTQSGNSAGGIRGQYDKNKVYNSGSNTGGDEILSLADTERLMGVMIMK